MRTDHKAIAKRLLKGRLAIVGYAEKRLRHLILEMLRRVLDNLNHKDLKRWLRHLHQRLRDAILAIVTEAVQMCADLISNYYPLPANYSVSQPAIKKYVYKHTRRFHSELLTWVGVRRILGMTKEQTMQAASIYLGKPFANPLFRQARLADRSVKRRSYGVGQYTSAFNALRRLSAYTIAKSFTQIQIDALEQTNPLAYWVVRTSSYPCATCEAQKGFHAKGDNNLPPYHPFCECIAYPVYATD